MGQAANVTTAAAGAVGGAAVNGVVGGVKGAAEGVQRGLSTGTKSTPAAALAIGALGVAGIVEWPILLAVGGGALLLRRLNKKPGDSGPPVKAKLTSVPSESEPEKAPPQKTTGKAPAKKAAGRRAGSTELRSTN
ncbi:membrane protein [Mycobacterium gastri 'Wayne']|nr:membrane protein [Mycobacterium gastri 'Wayne']